MILDKESLSFRRYEKTDYIYVEKKDLHSMGIGQKLINYLIDLANYKNFYKVTLTTQEYNQNFMRNVV